MTAETMAVTDAITDAMTDAMTVKAQTMAIATTGDAMINQLTTLRVAFDTGRSVREALPTSF
jgi:hypothetical protein